LILGFTSTVFFGFLADKRPADKHKTEDLISTTLDDIPEGKVDADKIKKAQKIVIHTTVKYIIMSYRFAIIPKSGETYIMSGIGVNLPKEIKAHLQNVKTGDMIYLAEIKAKTTDGHPISTNGASYEVDK
jgi:hypothetical protein